MCSIVRMAAAMLVSPAVLGQVVEQRVLLRSGDAVPGAPGAYLTGFSPPWRNDAGDMVFNAKVASDGEPISGDADDAAWLLPADGALRMLAREGQPASGCGAARFDAQLLPIVQSGVALAAFLKVEPGGATPENNYGIWRLRGDELQLVLRRGEPRPELVGSALYWVVLPTLFDDGRLYFAGYLQDGVDDPNGGPSIGFRAITAADDSIAFFSRGGDPAPGFPGEVLGAQLFNTTPIAASDGTVLYEAIIMGAAHDPRNDRSFWRLNPDHTVDLLWREGELAPTGDAYFASAGMYANSSWGMVTTTQLKTDPNLPDADDFGLWVQPRGEPLQLLLRKGDPAPGIAGATITRWFSHVRCNQRGDLAFRGEIDAGFAYWRRMATGDFEVLLRDDQPAPEVNALFDLRFSAFAPVAMNRRGDVALDADLKHTRFPDRSVDTRNDECIWTTYADQLRLLVREDQTIDIARPGEPPQLKTIDEFVWYGESGGDDALLRALDDNGWLSVCLRFTDATSAIVRLRVVCPGDVDGDGEVGLDDLLLVLARFGGDGYALNSGDADGDGRVGAEDVARVLESFGVCGDDS